MKKITSYILFSFILLTGCKKTEMLIDGEKPEIRVTEALKAYTDTLTKSTYGWKATLYPGKYTSKDPYEELLYNIGYSFYISFNDKNRVTMYSDLSTGTAVSSAESSYGIKSMQNLILYFDTFGIIPTLQSGSPLFDLDFKVDKIIGDTIKLTGQISNSKLVLIKATKVEQSAYQSKGLLSIINATNAYIDNNPVLYFPLADGTKIQTKLEYAYKTISLAWVEDGVFKDASTRFTYTSSGILLKEPLMFRGKKLTELFLDPVKLVYFLKVDGVRIDLAPVTDSIFPLYLAIGNDYLSLNVPDKTTNPGWGNDFIIRRAKAAASLIAIDFYTFRLGTMFFRFNAKEKTMILVCDVWTGPYRYQSGYYYTYSATTAGVFKFNYTPIQPETNESTTAGFSGTGMDPITMERLATDQFKIEYVTEPGTGVLLGQVTSVEHPDFTFNGALLKRL
ncbi:MAG: DUF4302 domain-containing protein [Bacteroidota bacterium]